MAAKLAQDRRRRVRDERPSALEVEPVERLDEPQAGDLDQVLQLLAGAAVAQRQGPRQGQEATNQLLPQHRVARLRIAAEQPALSLFVAGALAPTVSAGVGTCRVPLGGGITLSPRWLDR